MGVIGGPFAKIRRMLPRLSVALFLVFTARASTLLQLNTADLARASTSVVVGSVVGAHAVQSGRTIYTHFAIRVSEKWKGKAGAMIDVAVPGGVLNGMRQSYVGVPSLVPGQSYVLFLWTGKSGVTQVTGFGQGAFVISSNSAGSRSASRRPIGELMIGRDGKTVTDHAVQMLLSDMKSQVLNALGGVQ